MGKMKTIPIKGKDYVMVNERIKAFRENFKGYALTSEIIKLDEKSCIIKASIYDNEGNLVATGHAKEDKGSSNINTTSHIENCETSAWGRALGNFGIGIDDSICSADELIQALIGQGEITTETPEQIAERKLNGENPEMTTANDFKQFLSTMSPKLATELQVKDICRIAKEIKQPLDRICEKYGVKAIKELSVEQADEVLVKLKEAQK